MRSKLLAAGALVAGITLGTVGSAVGGEPPLPPITVTPESGTPGSTFTVSGAECFFLAPLSASDVETAGTLPAQGPLVVVTVGFPTALVAETNADSDGNWSVELTVPAGTPPGAYAVTADCQNEVPVESTGDVSAAQLYPPGATFTVLQGEVPVTPVVPEAGAATPAPAVAGAPRFTG